MQREVNTNNWAFQAFIAAIVENRCWHCLWDPYFPATLYSGW